MDLDKWKQKYYDQLDRLEQKEQDWQKLETTLKRTIGRLSLAAEGQDDSLDHHIIELRSAIKNNINPQQLDAIVDELSKLLSKFEEKQNAPKRESIQTLEQLIKNLELPDKISKEKNKLLEKFSKSDDSNRDLLLKETLKLLISVIDNENNIVNQKKPSIIKRIFNSNKETNSDGNQTPENLIRSPEQDLKLYKACFIDLLNKIDNKNSPNGKITALKVNISNAQQQKELDKLSEKLSEILKEKTPNNKILELKPDIKIDDNLQPTIQELLIQLLEQLTVPNDLHTETENLKQRLEKETSPDNWKKLLRDVTTLINSIRSRMQKEKNEFENFLQQVTVRLKSMDNFLQNETINLTHAKTNASEFDNQIELNVKEVRLDIDQATELSDLKECVTLKLDKISEHIKIYRDSENSRFENSQKEINEMHSKMHTMESEAEQLKRIIIKANKEAMFDALTDIPNRLSYEKRITEEINRWKRFSTPLSIAIWDIDLFKQVNDTYGHKAGDKVLKTVAQLLIKSIRKTDFLARYGGEEFIMLLPGTEQKETMTLVNKLREKISSCGFRYHGNAVKISISCGVSGFNNEDTLEHVFERADKALYQAKENGRNQCVLFSKDD